ncbi:MAG: BON domain-containing protein [Magnetospirillum sp.]|nr:BON domain-containing protein [Magnetospirillum sp.]
MRRPIVLLLAVVTLSGCGTADQGPSVSQAAHPAPERTVSERERDDALASAVTGRIRGLDGRAYRTVTATVLAGRVLLTGAVVKPEQRRNAEQAAAQVPGVVDVRDEIQLVEERFFDRYLPDPGSETALSARLAADPAIAASDYEIRVVDGVVYLLGSAGSPAAVEHVKEVLAAEPSVKWVVVAVTRP